MSGVWITFPFVALFVWIWYRSQRNGRRAFAACAETLRMTDPKVTARSLTGTVGGRTIRVTHTTGSEDTPSRFVVDVDCPESAVVLHLRRETGVEVEKMLRGEVIDIELGDKGFDDRWVIEGAPKERVERLLGDAELKRAIDGVAHLEEVGISIDEGKVTVRRRGSDYDGKVVTTHRIELALRLAQAVSEESALALPSSTAVESPYRSVVVRDVSPHTEAEVVRLRQVVALREIAAQERSIYITHLTLLVFAVVGIALATKPFIFLPIALFGAFGAVKAWQNWRRKRAIAPLTILEARPYLFAAGTWIVALGFLAARFLRF